MTIGELASGKTGGRSGTYRRPGGGSTATSSSDPGRVGLDPRPGTWLRCSRREAGGRGWIHNGSPTAGYIRSSGGTTGAFALTIAVILVLGVLWIAVLVPPILRARRAEPIRLGGDFHHKLSRSVVRTVTGCGRHACRRSSPSSCPVAPGRDDERDQKRRRDVLFVLLGWQRDVLPRRAHAFHAFRRAAAPGRHRACRVRVPVDPVQAPDPGPAVEGPIPRRRVPRPVAVPERPVRAGTAGAERSTARPAPANGLPLVGGSDPWSTRVRSRPQARRRRRSSSGSTRPARSEATSPRVSCERVGHPRGAPARVPRRVRSSRRQPRTWPGGERARRAQRRALRRVSPGRQGSPRPT